LPTCWDGELTIHTKRYVSGDPIEYSPDGKKITYMSYEGFNDGSPTGLQKDAEIYTIAERWGNLAFK
jgi:hypothetical protein